MEWYSGIESMKKIVVSAIFGGNDYIKDPVFDGYNPNWEYHLFTDDPSLESDIWQIHHIPGSREVARDIKIRTHKYLQYGVRLWIDASMVLKENPDAIYEHMNSLQESDCLFKVHPERDTTYQEIDACIKFNRITEKEGQIIREYFKPLGYTKAIQDSTVIFETGLNLVRNTSEMVTFCEKWWQVTKDVFYRDQLALPFVIWQLRPKMFHFTQQEYDTWVMYSYHTPFYDLPDISYYQPFAIDGNLGKEYNYVQNGHDDDDWICITDQDVCFLDSRLKLWIAKTVVSNPDFDIFTCMTNRLSDSQQLVKGMYDIADIRMHKMATINQWKKFGTKVKEATQPTAGLFMLMKARTLRSVPFRNGLIYLDTDFYLRALAEDYRVGIMRGIYIFHYYRLSEGKGSISHLRRTHFK